MKTKIVLSIILGLILVSSGVYFLFNKQGEGTKILEENLIKQNIPKINNQLAVAKIECHDSSKYFVIAKEDLESAGEDILVKYKTNLEQIIPCEYIIEKNDFELKNDMGQWFSFIYGDNLFLDNGTSSTRQLVIYNLISKEKKYSDTIASSIRELKIINDMIDYWSIDKKFPTKQNCPNLDEFLKMGSARIENFVTLNLLDYSKKISGQSRCVYSE